MRRLFVVSVLLICIACGTVKAQVIRIGIIGDSNSDEYRADDNRGGAYSATTFNWVELLVRYRALDAGAWGSYGGERRTGYAYNWARSAATSGSMISTGQHTSLANQIAAGSVDYAVVYIGQNDFHTWNGTYAEVYNNTLSNAALQTKIDTIVANITTAVDTLLAAQPDGVILLNYSDPGVTPAFIAQFPNAAGRARVTGAINQINTQLAALALSRGIVLGDLAQYSAYLLSLVDANYNIVVGGEPISLLVKGDEPHHVQLGDSVGHGGTVVNGLLANFIIGLLVDEYGVMTQPFSSAELLTNAGISVFVPSATPTPTNTPTYTFTPTFTYTPTPTFTPTYTETPTATYTETYTPTFTPTFTETFTPTATFTETPTDTPTFTATPTDTDTPTPTATDTDTPTVTPSPTETSTDTPTATATSTDTPTATSTPTDTPTALPTISIVIIPIEGGGYEVWVDGERVK